MIAEPVPGFLDVVRSSHQRAIRMTLMTWQNDVLTETAALNVESGTLTIDSTAASWRRLTANVALDDPDQAANVISTDNAEVRVEMGVNMSGGGERNLLTVAQATLTGSIYTGNGSGATVSDSAALNGSAYELTLSGSSAGSLWTAYGSATVQTVNPGDVVTAHAKIKAGTIPARVAVLFYNNASGLIGGINYGNTVTNTAAYEASQVTMTAPAGTVYALCRVYSVGGGVGLTFRVDRLGLWFGEGGLWEPPADWVWVQVGQLRVEEVRRQAMRKSLAVTAFDRMNRVADFPFITPYAPRDINGNLLTKVDAIKDIITTAFPSATPPTFVVDDTIDLSDVPPEEAVFTGARIEAINSLADSISATVHNDSLGRFVIRSKRPVLSVDSQIVSGDGGTLTQFTSTATRVEQFNAVGLSAELPNSEGSLFVYVVDNDPQSPTYYDGPFGRKPYMVRNDMVADEESAILAARAILARKKTAAKDISLSAVYNPLLEPLDGIYVSSASLDLSELHTIESIEFPLATGEMSISAYRWSETTTAWGELRFGRSWAQVPTDTLWEDAFYVDRITPA